MKKTLQDQYLLIKEGKGHKGVFLAEVKRQYPNIVRNAATFDEAVSSLKTKNIISENVISVMPAIMDRPKKESYETAFENFLAEAKKQNEDEKVKAEEKKVSKPVEEDLSHNYDNSDDKNPDNMIFDQIMTGYYAEMKDPKNADKTMQELKDIVFKNLAKDPIYYTKDGQFGVKGLGYTTEAPGLGEPKEAKGKYKSSGYGDLKESQEYYTDEDEDEEEVKDVRDMSWTKGFTKEEQTLREVVRKMIDEELKKEEYASVLYQLESPYLKDKKALDTIQKIYSSHIQQLNSLSQRLQESVEKDLADINKEAEHEVLQSKLDKIDDLIDHRRSKLSKLDEDEDMKALTDKKKVKELEKDIKKLEAARKKVEKILSKFKGKKADPKEVIDETEDGEDIPFEGEDLENYIAWQRDSDIGQSEELDTDDNDSNE